MLAATVMGPTGFFPSEIDNRTREPGSETLLSCVCCLGRVIAAVPRSITAYNAHVLRLSPTQNLLSKPGRRGVRIITRQTLTSINFWTWLLWSRLRDISGGALLPSCSPRRRGARLCASHGYDITGNQGRCRNPPKETYNEQRKRW